MLLFQAKKPLMEKMRRARINDSLNEMKSLVLDLLHKDVSWMFLFSVTKSKNSVVEFGFDSAQNVLRDSDIICINRETPNSQIYIEHKIDQPVFEQKYL